MIDHSPISGIRRQPTLRRQRHRDGPSGFSRGGPSIGSDVDGRNTKTHAGIDYIPRSATPSGAGSSGLKPTARGSTAPPERTPGRSWLATSRQGPALPPQDPIPGTDPYQGYQHPRPVSLSCRASVHGRPVEATGRRAVYCPRSRLTLVGRHAGGVCARPVTGTGPVTDWRQPKGCRRS